ncbi:MAG: PLDc N-terminal domain-containing protein [Candidatus Izemoplasmataceae bacterium]
MEEITQIVLLLMPLLIVELAMRIYVILDILKEERHVLGQKKILWILFCGVVTLGWIVYLTVGRED